MRSLLNPVRDSKLAILLCMVEDSKGGMKSGIPEPVTLATLKPGVRYFRVSLERDGSLALEPTIYFIGKPFTGKSRKGDRPYTILWRNGPDESIQPGERLLHQCGIVPNMRFDFERTFLCDPQSLVFFAQLVEADDFDGYLQAIGAISNKERSIEPIIRERRARKLAGTVPLKEAAHPDDLHD